MHAYAAAGARNNADWCELVCRTHGVATARDHHGWVALRRSPPMYPDAVTLSEDASADELLRRLDMSAGCSVKDSFASIDLTAIGFRVLFEAEWIYRLPVERATDNPATWAAVRTPEQLRAFSAAHGGGEVFRPGLLDDAAVVVLAAWHGDAVVGGAVGNHSDSVVGISNLFSTTAAADEVWAGAVAAVSAVFPGLPLVGYELGASLAAAHRAGFRSAGPLQVWLKD